MRIGLVIPTAPSYSETFFNTKIKGLKKNGFEVILFAQKINPKFTLCKAVEGPKVRANKLLFFFDVAVCIIKLIPHLRKVLRYKQLLKNAGFSKQIILKRLYLNSHLLTQKLDWLHFGFTTQAVGSELVAKAIGARMAVSFRGFDINVYPLKHKNCYKYVWDNVNKIHSISNYLVNKAYGLGLEASVPVSVITPAINWKIVEEIKQKSITEDDKSIKIVTVARLNWIKDLVTAFKTIYLLKSKYVNLSYHIVGDGNIKEKEHCLYMIEQLGLERYVTFHHKLSHIQTLELINESTIYLQTSLNEGFCNAVLEAQALGKLCVASRVGGLTENIIDGKTGWLIEPQTPDLFAEKIIEVHQLTNEEKLEISNNAVERVKKYFLSKYQDSEFQKFYN